MTCLAVLLSTEHLRPSAIDGCTQSTANRETDVRKRCQLEPECFKPGAPRNPGGSVQSKAQQVFPTTHKQAGCPKRCQSAIPPHPDTLRNTLVAASGARARPQSSQLREPAVPWVHPATQASERYIATFKMRTARAPRGSSTWPRSSLGKRLPPYCAAARRAVRCSAAVHAPSWPNSEYRLHRRATPRLGCNMRRRVVFRCATRAARVRSQCVSLTSMCPLETLRA